MIKLFVDANVFLQFFREDMPRFHGLMASLEELSPHIFITERVASEVRRNKVQVAQAALGVLDRQLTFPSVRLPEHLDEGPDLPLRALNLKLAELHKEVKDVARKFCAHSDHLLSQIATSQDHTSRALERLFLLAIAPTEGQVERARTRHMYGDPPGKPAGALGDQVSWEQLLDSTTPTDELFIVTRDTDFFHSIGGKQFLNPVLARDVAIRAPQAPVPRVFSKLVDALEEIRAVLPPPLAKGPSPADLEAIRKEESAVELPESAPSLRSIRQVLQDTRAKTSNESMLHYLMREEQVTGLGQALVLATKKILAQAGELDEATSATEKRKG